MSGLAHKGCHTVQAEILFNWLDKVAHMGYTYTTVRVRVGVQRCQFGRGANIAMDAC